MPTIELNCARGQQTAVRVRCSPLILVRRSFGGSSSSCIAARHPPRPSFFTRIPPTLPAASTPNPSPAGSGRLPLWKRTLERELLASSRAEHPHPRPLTHTHTHNPPQSAWRRPPAQSAPSVPVLAAHYTQRSRSLCLPPLILLLPPPLLPACRRLLPFLLSPSTTTDALRTQTT